MTGKAFLPRVLDGALLYVEAAFNADRSADPSTWTWTDLSADMLDDPGVQITAGRQDETSQCQPAQCTLALLNDDGDYSNYHPLGLPWPGAWRGTPLRVSVDPGTGSATVVFFGEVSSSPPAWDISGERPTVQITAAGIRRRLGQGSKPLLAPSTMTALGSDDLIAYWPLDDGTDAAAAASPVGGVAAMKVSGSVAFGSDASPGTVASADFSGGGHLTGVLPSHTGGLRVALTFRIDAETDNSGDFCWLFQLNLDGQTWALSWTDDGTLALSSTTLFEVSPLPLYDDVNSTTPAIETGKWYCLIVDLGGDADGNLLVDWLRTGPDPDDLDSVPESEQDDNGLEVWFPPDATTTLRSITIGAAPISVADAPTTTAFHVAAVGVYAWDNTTSAADWTLPVGWAALGFAGEAAHARFQRLNDARSIDCTEFPADGSHAEMGVQPVTTWLATQQEVEAADQAIIFDGFGSDLRIRYGPGFCNQDASLTLDMADGDVDDPFEPSDDDQRTRNDVTVSRPNGSTATVTVSAGQLGTDVAGDYQESIQVNTSDDAALRQIASWRAHVGTFTGYRYPRLNIDLAARTNLITDWLAAQGSIGWRADVTNVNDTVSQHPAGTVRQIVEGWTQHITTHAWTAMLNCSPYGPYEVAVVGTTWRIDSADAQLDADADATDTTISVRATDAWVTDADFADDFPFDILVGGIKATVTACGAASDGVQTMTLDAALGTGRAAGAAVRLYRPPALAL